MKKNITFAFILLGMYLFMSFKNPQFEKVSCFTKVLTIGLAKLKQVKPGLYLVKPGSVTGPMPVEFHAIPQKI